MKGWELTNDRVLVRKIEEQTPSGLFLAPKDPGSVDAANGDYRRTVLKGEVLAVGPGKWVTGEWWWVGGGKASAMRAQVYPDLLQNSWEWEWIDAYRQAPEVRPGQIVLFGDWNDLPEIEAGHALIQEADILVVVN